MQTEALTYQDHDTALHGHIAYQSSETKKPAVIVFHDWSGCNPFAINKAKELAELGYVGFAADIYGEGQVGTTLEEKQALITPFTTDRAKLSKRVHAAFDAIKNHPAVDGNKIAAIGFCFGGLCALDLARTSKELKGVVSFHGLLNRPEDLPISPISADILVLHGFEDPMVPPEQVLAFCEEMQQSDASWQIDMYGKTQHAFTNPEAHDTNLGTIYEPKACTRAMQSMTHFLEEIF